MSYAQLTNRGSLRDIENCLTALALTKKKMHMNQSSHTISKNVGVFLTDKNPINELFKRTVPEKESTDYYMPSLFGLEDF